MSFTRRHLGREAVQVIRFPFTPIMSKRPGVKGLSAFRIIAVTLAYQFVQHWPGEWGPWSWAALTTIALMLPFDDLFSAVPVAEMWEAGRSALGRVADKVSATVTTKLDMGGGGSVAAAAPATPQPEKGEGDQ